MDLSKFEKTTRKVKRKYWWKNLRVIFLRF
jgi:hypothetical protein